MADASHGRVAWSHWEQGTNGPLAVFRYSVPKEFANFTVLGFANIPQLPAYHGELAVDPATGAILRITVISDWQAPFQDHLSQILVEYGSVLIGDNLYNCPVRGVAITRVPTRTADYGWLGSYALPLQVFVNDVSFTQYRLFRGDVRIIPDAPAPATP
jgi:hypothetical protein